MAKEIKSKELKMDIVLFIIGFAIGWLLLDLIKHLIKRNNNV
jgi:uncharacterized membrane protein YciS (DUF1049 family)